MPVPVGRSGCMPYNVQITAPPGSFVAGSQISSMWRSATLPSSSITGIGQDTQHLQALRCALTKDAAVRARSWWLYFDFPSSGFYGLLFLMSDLICIPHGTSIHRKPRISAQRNKATCPGYASGWGSGLNFQLEAHVAAVQHLFAIKAGHGLQTVSNQDTQFTLLGEALLD